MKKIHYDAEGDILTVTFAESKGLPHTGIDLADNIVLYLDEQTGQPLELLVIDYQLLRLENLTRPITLDGVNKLPADLEQRVQAALKHSPLNSILEWVDTIASMPRVQLQAVLTPVALRAMA
jgi:hypothetical protein